MLTSLIFFSSGILPLLPQHHRRRLVDHDDTLLGDIRPHETRPQQSPAQGTQEGHRFGHGHRPGFGHRSAMETVRVGFISK